MAIKLLGLFDWSLKTDKEGQRTYTAKWKVDAGDAGEGIARVGPQRIAACPGLPAVGAGWNFGGDNDPWATCSPESSVTPAVNDPEGCSIWFVEQNFSTKPLKRCQSGQIENPLLEPPDISGSFLTYSRERQYDRHGHLLATSAGEMLKGQGTEVEESTATVSIKMNTAQNMLSVFTPLLNLVNSSPMWGMPKRCVRLKNAPWQRKVYATCGFYYTTTYEFEVSLRKDDAGNFIGFDKIFYDYGTMCICKDLLVDETDGSPLPWTAEEKDAFVAKGAVGKYTDKYGKEAECFLDGHGAPIPPVPSNAVKARGELIDEANLLILGVPASL